MNLIRTLAVLCCVAIAGCGGGGSNELAIGALSPAAVNTAVSNLPSNSGQDVALTASYSGTASGPVYVVVVDPDAVFTAVAYDATVPPNITLHLFMSGLSPIGRYTRPIVLHVCHEAACTSEYPGFPRTIPKDVRIEGTTTNASSLSFTSSAGVPSASQSIAVTTPAGATFDVDDGIYATYAAPDGSTSSLTTASVFSITKSATGFDVHANAAYEGRYTARMSVMTNGYQTVQVDLDYQVGASTTPVVTALTTSVAATATVGSSEDRPIYVDVRFNVLPVTGQSIAIVPTGGLPDPVPTFWLRYYDQTAFTNVAGSSDNTTRLRFYVNDCFLGQNCVAAGHYTANIVYSATAWGVTSTFTVPLTIDVSP